MHSVILTKLALIVIKLLVNCLSGKRLVRENHPGNVFLGNIFPGK